MSKAVYKIIVDGQAKWVHVSQRKETVKLRWFGPDYKEPKVLDLSKPEHDKEWKDLLRNAQEFSIPEITEHTNALPFSADQLKADKDSDKWSEVFDQLNRLGDIAPVSSAGRSATARPKGGARSPIPQTRLRRFYETMRLLNEADLQDRIVNYLIGAGGKRADRIQVMFSESESHFCRYSNVEEPFHNRKSPDWFNAYINRPGKFARCVVARLKQYNGNAVSVPGYEQVQVVDYEISPFRTTGAAQFENGKAGTSGGGGIDLLLRESESGVPVIGEIKAPTDSDLFLALIQALTYAVELTTPSQMERLVRHYGHVGFHVADSKCTILLLYRRNEYTKLMEQTKKLAELLLKIPDSAVARRVRRIVLVSAELHGEAGIELRCEWSTPS
jgi:hypothetical protein